MRPSPRHEGAAAGRQRLGSGTGRDASGASRRRSPRSQRGPRGGRVDRAQRSGASLNTATRGKPLRLEPRTCEDAWATGAPAPQRPSRGHRRGEGSPAPATDQVRTGVQRPDPEAQRSGARGRVGTGNGIGNGIGNGCDLAHIYTYIPLPTQHERPRVSSPPDSVRGRRPGGASVCGRARARGISNLGAQCNSKTVMLFTE